MIDFNWVDYLIIGVFTISILIGIYRGILREAVTVVIWGLAAIITFMYGKKLGQIFTIFDSEYLKAALGRSILFALLVIGGNVAKYFVFKSKRIGKKISGLGRFLGAGFGVLRGVVIVVAALFFLSATAVEDRSGYVNSRLIPQFQFILDFLDIKMPDKWKLDKKQETKAQDPITEEPVADIVIIEPEVNN